MAKFLSVEDQVKILRKQFRELKTYDSLIEKDPVPKYASGYGVIPNYRKIAGSYPAAVKLVFECIRKLRTGGFAHQLMFDAGHVRRSQHAEQMWQQIAQDQGGNDLFVIPVQMGSNRQFESVDTTRESYKESEFGLGLFEVACFLLTHPDHLVRATDLWIMCPGDECSKGISNMFVNAGMFYLNPNLGCMVEPTKEQNEVVGSATGFRRKRS